MNASESTPAFQRIHKQLDKYEEILKAAKTQVKNLLQSERLRDLGEDANLMRNLDNTREIIL